MPISTSLFKYIPLLREFNDSISFSLISLFPLPQIVIVFFAAFIQLSNWSLLDEYAFKVIEKFVYEIENNILSSSLNKCVANIYTLLNYLEKNKIYLGENEISKKILVCLFPITPRLSSLLSKKLFNIEISKLSWPEVNESLIIENEINLPIQLKGKLISTVNTKKGYNEKDLLEKIYKIEKINNKINGKKILRVINVQDKIINIITS